MLIVVSAADAKDVVTLYFITEVGVVSVMYTLRVLKVAKVL